MINLVAAPHPARAIGPCAALSTRISAGSGHPNLCSYFVLDPNAGKFKPSASAFAHRTGGTKPRPTLVALPFPRNPFQKSRSRQKPSTALGGRVRAAARRFVYGLLTKVRDGIGRRARAGISAPHLPISPLTNLATGFTAGFEGRSLQASVITTFSGQSVRVNCRAMLPSGDIHFGRNRLLVARWWG
jgi:hypothetical protein